MGILESVLNLGGRMLGFVILLTIVLVILVAGAADDVIRFIGFIFQFLFEMVRIAGQLINAIVSQANGA